MKKAMLLNPELMDSEKYDENKIKESADCLMEAEDIKKDEVLMGKIKKYLEGHKDKITSLADLKDKANNFSSEKKNA